MTKRNFPILVPAAPGSPVRPEGSRLGRGHLLGLAMTLLCSTLVLGASGRPAQAELARSSGAQEEPTPVIDPQPLPEPIHLPLVQLAYDPVAPGAVVSKQSGFLSGLSRSGRDACRPGTHALLDKPEGSPGAVVLAVLQSDLPGINLDFHVGDYVEVEGTVDLAPVECRILTHWAMRVSAIQSVDIPPRP